MKLIQQLVNLSGGQMQGRLVVDVEPRLDRFFDVENNLQILQGATSDVWDCGIQTTAQR
jgi:hypothetical protein